jgi:hypothetical protein
MPLRRPGAGLERGEIDAELIETGGVAEPLAPAPQHRLPEWLGICGGVIKFEIGDVDLGHVQTLGTLKLKLVR